MQYADELQESLLEQKRRVLSAIRERDEDQVNDGLRVYYRLIGRFLDQTSQYGLRYGREQAESEGTPFTSVTGWEGIDWIRSDYHSFVEETFREAYRPALFSVLHFPFSLAARAVEKQDYFIFQKFILEPGAFPYGLTAQLEDEDLRELVVEKFAGYARDFVRYRLRPILDDAVVPSDLSFVGEIGEGVCLYLNVLMKQAIDSGRIEDFLTFKKELDSLWLGVSWRIDGHDDWEMWNRILDDTEMRERYGGREHALHKAFEEMTRELRERVRLIRFGLAGWILRGFANRNRDVDETRAWLDACGTLGNLSQLLSTYAEALNYQVQEELGWSRWVMERMPRDTVVTIDPSSSAHLVPIYYGVQLNLRDEKKDVLPHGIEKARRLSHAVNDGGLDATVANLSRHEEQAERWEKLLGLKVQDVQKWFYNLFEQVRWEYDQEWEHIVRVAQVSDAKVEEFQSGIELGFERSATLPRIFRLQGRWKEVVEGQGSYRSERWIGYHHRLDKGLFVEDSPTTIKHLGEGYGEGLARSEAVRVLEEIRNGAMPTRDLQGVDDPLAEVEKEVLRLRGEGRKRLGVLLVQGWPIYRRLELGDLLANRQSDEFDDQTPYIGTYKNVPVFRSHAGEHTGALIAEFAQLGEWHRYRPFVREENEDLVVKEYLRFSVQEIDKETARGMVDEGGDEGREGNELTVEELLLQVRLRLFSRVEWEWGEPEAGVWLNTPKGMD